MNLFDQKYGVDKEKRKIYHQGRAWGTNNEPTSKTLKNAPDLLGSLGP